MQLNILEQDGDPHLDIITVQSHHVYHLKQVARTNQNASVNLTYAATQIRLMFIRQGIQEQMT